MDGMVEGGMKRERNDRTEPNQDQSKAEQSEGKRSEPNQDNHTAGLVLDSMFWIRQWRKDPASVCTADGWLGQTGQTGQTTGRTGEAEKVGLVCAGRAGGYGEDWPTLLL